MATRADSSLRAESRWKADSDAASQLGLSIDDLHPIDELHDVHLLFVDGMARWAHKDT